MKHCLESVKAPRNTAVLAALAAALICLLVYLRATSCGFVNFDDPLYVLENTAIRVLNRESVARMFTTPYGGFWMPLTWLSFAVDYHFWQLNPVGYHLTNILLHALNTGLVVLIADRLYRKALPETESTSAPRYLYPGMLLLAGLLFGIHPLRVESVAWVTERKDVLNGLFSLCSILCYLFYAQKRETMAGRGAFRHYVFSLVFLLLSLMAKSVSVVIPALLLIADWYPLNRFRKGNILPVLVEKLPFLALAALMAWATIYFAAESDILVTSEQLSFGKRVVLSGNGIFESCRLLLYPVGIIHLYLIPRPIPASFAVKTMLVVGITCFSLCMGRKRPWITATWLFFLIPLVPALALFQNGAQAYAARFTYLPSVVPSIAVAAIITLAFKKTLTAHYRYPRYLCATLIGMLLLFNGALSARLITAWENSETLWSRLISIQPIGRAYFFRADYYLETGKYLAAAADLLISAQMAEKAGNPEAFNLYALRGEAFSRGGRYEDAARSFTEAIERYPLQNYYYQRGLALKKLGRVTEAEEDLRRAGSDTGPLKWVDMW